MDPDKRKFSRSTPELTNLAAQLVSTRLPSAVAIVPPEHIRGYVHSKKINHYLLGETLGEGSFSKVTEALHILVGEKVAMKIIDKKEAPQRPYVAKKFIREAELMQMVRHPNISQLYEVIETDSNFYLVSELCLGGELMKYVSYTEKCKLDEEETQKFMRQIVSAVDHLHRAGIIHRDLSLENILLDSDINVKIIGLGQSNDTTSEYGHIHLRWSLYYTAPELLGGQEYGKEVDIWSIGVTMYTMLTGCLPYTVDSPLKSAALLKMILENAMNPIPEHLSSECKDLIQSLLRPKPSERITMEEILIHPWMNKGQSEPLSPAPFPNRLTPDDIKEEIIEHIVQKLKFHESTYELKQELLQNRPTSSTAVYHLLAARLARYNSGIKSSIVRKPSSDQISPPVFARFRKPKASSYSSSQHRDDNNSFLSLIRRVDSGLSSLDSLSSQSSGISSPKLQRMPLNTANYHLGSVGRTYATVAREGGMPNISVSAELFGNLKHKEDQQMSVTSTSVQWPHTSGLHKAVHKKMSSGNYCDRPMCKAHEDLHKATQEIKNLQSRLNDLIESRCFHSRNLRVNYSGRKYVIKEHSITIMIPEGAIQHGETVEFITAVAMYGPFKFSQFARPISPILMICPKSHPDLVLTKPMEVTLPHYLTYLEEGDYEKYDITFAKADHTSKRLKFQPLRNKAAEVDMQFIMDGDQGYGILRSTHCCFLCITSCRGDRKIHMEQTLKAGYCLSRIEAPFLDHPGSVQITFYVSFMLSTCLEVLKSQFPAINRTVSHKKFRLANSGTDSEPSLQIIINRESNDYQVVGVDPSNLKIYSSHVEFWDKADEIELLQETQQYPPRAQVTVHLTADSSMTPVTFPTRFLGCTEDSNLDVDIPLLLPHDYRLKVSKTLECVTGDLRIAERHLPGLFQQLNNHASKWRLIGLHLGFLPGELSNIEARPILLQDAPVSYLGALLEQSIQWAPGDSRGSTGFTTLDSLKAALIKAGLAATAHDLKTVSA